MIAKWSGKTTARSKDDKKDWMYNISKGVEKSIYYNKE
jgi:hypothetical protein